MLCFSSFSRSYPVMWDWITAEQDWLSGLREWNNMRAFISWIFSAICRGSKGFFIKVMHFLGNLDFHGNNSIFLRCFYSPACGQVEEQGGRSWCLVFS